MSINLSKKQQALSQLKGNPIGWEGKTLKQMRQDMDEVSRSTGHYAGLERS